MSGNWIPIAMFAAVALIFHSIASCTREVRVECLKQGGRPSGENCIFDRVRSEATP